MVLLAVAIATRNGQILVSRQFVEMTRSRVEGLIATFPKLIDREEQLQHTFLETNEVRYVYQLFDKLFLILLTTKASNILEDLETLKLFAKVVPEYCKSVTEKDVLEHAFDLIFAFDEIVALGYREKVNLTQIRTITEMDSHDERVFMAMRNTQIRDAKEKMKEKARELEMIRKTQGKTGAKVSYGGGIGASSMSSSTASVPSSRMNTFDETVPKSSFSSMTSKPTTSVPGHALKLSSHKNTDNFFDQIRSEGQPLSSNDVVSDASKPTSSSETTTNKIAFRLEEKLNARCNHEGIIEALDVSGIMLLRISDAALSRLRIYVDHDDSLKNIQMQTHPNFDKKLFQSESVLCLRQSDKPFPVMSDIAILKWHCSLHDESELPLIINCWPSDLDNSSEMTIEYELQDKAVTLTDVVISIPFPMGVNNPVISHCDGDYACERIGSNKIQWKIPVIDVTNSQGTFEFSINGGHSSDFFPIKINFTSKTILTDMQIKDVVNLEEDESVDYSANYSLTCSSYEVI